jgi:hypothetical protein
MKKRLIALISIVLLCGLAVFTQAQSTPKEKIAKETMKYASQGSAAYLEQDYKRAIQLYSKALELEKQEPTLEKNVWRVEDFRARPTILRFATWNTCPDI